MMKQPPIDEEEMVSRGVHEKYLNALEEWIGAIVTSKINDALHRGDVSDLGNLQDTRRRLVNVIFTGEP